MPCNECNKWKQKHDHIFAEVRRQSESIAALEAENARMREAARWRICSEEPPELDTPVIVQSATYPKNITCAMRYDDGDGWLWGQLTGYNATLNRPDSYEFDDDYDYLAWLPLPTPPPQDEQDGEAP